ncbi:MAG: ATP-dependent Clp protease proteolytic subunit, partial [Candidatus Bathyarchaeia archaeon]
MSNTLIPLLQTGERLWINEARKRRRVWLLGEINNYRGAKCCYMLAELASESSEPIYFILNTEGGDVDVALGMYDLVDSIRRSGTQVITVGTGYVCSAG